MKKLLFALLFTATVTAVGCSPKQEEPKPAEVPAAVDSAAIKAAADSVAKAAAAADSAAKAAVATPAPAAPAAK